MTKKNAELSNNDLQLIQELGLFERNGKAWVSSREVAKRFDKRHDRVIRKIRNLLADLAPQKWGTKNNFHEITCIDNRGKDYPEFIMNKKGFSLLAMRFTGKRALEWQVKYVDAFDLMEQFIVQRQSAEWQQARLQGKQTRRELTDAIQQLIPYAEEQGSKNMAKQAYRSYAKMGNNICGTAGVKRDSLDMHQLRDRDVIELVQTNGIYSGMSNEQHYKQIYKDTDAAGRDVWDRILKPAMLRRLQNTNNQCLV